LSPSTAAAAPVTDAFGELRRALAHARRRPPPQRATSVTVAFSTFTPWWAQRLAMRSSARLRVIVAGRQAGKTALSAFLVLRRAFERPRSESALLVPALRWGEAALQRLREVVDGIPGVRWKEQKRRLVLPNGAFVELFSADRGEGPRGRTITGTYWIDEAARVDEDAYRSGSPTQIATQAPTTIVTSTPVGKGWLWHEFTSEEPTNARFRFRSEDSPFTDKDEIARQRRAMTRELAAQEFDAVFVDDLLLAFPDVSRLFVKAFPDRSREKDLHHVLGVDLAKEQDWVVCTLMNRYGEARIVGRWRRVAWPQTEREVVAMARAFDATVVLDAGVNGGPGSYLKDALVEHGVRVLPINTGVLHTKHQLVEQCRGDVQWERIHVLENAYTEQLRHEFTLFQGVRGKEVTTWEGLQVRGEHDDCVISLCLANWGRFKGAGAGEALPDVAREAAEFQGVNARIARLFPYRFPSPPGYRTGPAGGPVPS
jgi:phage terminase large subunit-like protein